MDPLDRDPLERDLRNLLTDDRLSLPTHLVRVDAVHAGAVRRRRRRAAVTAVAGAVVVAAVAGSALLAHQPRSSTGGGPASSTSGGTGHHTDGASASNGATTVPTPTAPSWDGARVVSMTATSTDVIVVLGALGDAGGCTSPDCLRLAESHDGGATFTGLPVPQVQYGGPDGGTSSAATDIRFGSAMDGWLFGGGLWSTHDGGGSWLPLHLGGQVRRLEAAEGRVWALVAKSAGTEVLYSAPVGSDTWTKVPQVQVTGPGDLAVQGARVVVLGAGQSPGWSNAGGQFRPVDNPCAGSLQVRLSGSGSLWATCVTGTAAFVATSDDDGSTWSQVPVDTGQGSLPNSVAVAARSTGEAVLGVPQQAVARLGSDGTLTPVAAPPTGGDVDYLGFTNRHVGYAIVGGASLWRTDDGAETWQRLDVRTP